MIKIISVVGLASRQGFERAKVTDCVLITMREMYRSDFNELMVILPEMRLVRGCTIKSPLLQTTTITTHCESYEKQISSASIFNCTISG
jgi:hypothetical protein